MKRATVYLRKEFIYLHSASETTAGVWMLSAPCVKLARDCTNHELGEQTLRAIAESRTGLPHPRQWGAVLEPLLRLAKARSWGDFARQASCAEVEEDGERISVTPTENLGAEEGFRSMAQSATLLEKPACEVVGAAVREALGRRPTS